MKTTMKMDGPLRLNLGEDDFSDELMVSLMAETPSRTGKGRQSIRVRQFGKGMNLRWRVRLYGYLVAQSYGADIPQRPKDGPRRMRWFNGVTWITKNTVKGYRMKPQGFIDRAIDSFLKDHFAPNIGWAKGKAE